MRSYNGGFLTRRDGKADMGVGCDGILTNAMHQLIRLRRGYDLTTVKVLCNRRLARSTGVGRRIAPTSGKHRGVAVVDRRFWRLGCGSGPAAKSVT